MAPNRPSKDAQNAGSILEDAETQLEIGNVDDAISLALRALDITGEGGDFQLRALNLLGVLHVESGDIDDARSYFERAAKLDEDGTLSEKVGGGPEKFLFLAQLSEEGGQDSVRWFERGAAALRKQIQTMTEDGNKTTEHEALRQARQGKLGEVLCAVAEVYMTDLSWEADAEERCEALITEAMMIAPESAETWQTVANVRVSQERVEEAQTALRRSLALWQDLPPEHPAVPEFPTRIGLARLLLEVGMEDEASQVLDRLISDDDQSVEAWYLGGWCLYIVGEKLSAATGQQNGDTDEWKASWASARRWLTQCLKLYEAQDYEDERLGEHASELLQSLNKELGEPPEGDEDGWEDASDNEEDEEDEVMQG